MDYSDVQKDAFMSRRNGNPLDPVYQTMNENGQLISYGHIEGSAPKRAPYREHGPTSMDLKTSDIPGAVSTSMGAGLIYNAAVIVYYTNVISKIREGMQTI